MEGKQRNTDERQTDPHLDIPSEANRDKHIDFREAEQEGGEFISFKNKDEVKQRREEWQEGIREGEKEKEGKRQND